MSHTIPAVSLWQPFATLIAIGAKPHETRSWAAPKHLIGGPIAIHAAAKWDGELSELCREEPYCSVLAEAGYREWRQAPGARLLTLEGLPLGAVVCVGVLKECLPTERVTGLTETQRGFGDYSPGRFAWKIGQVRRLDPPVPAKGSQGIWRIDLNAPPPVLAPKPKPVATGQGMLGL